MDVKTDERTYSCTGEWRSLLRLLDLSADYGLRELSIELVESLYPLGPEGKIAGPPVELVAERDLDAIDVARNEARYLECVEIWQGSRCVGLVTE